MSEILLGQKMAFKLKNQKNEYQLFGKKRSLDSSTLFETDFKTQG